MAHSLSTNPIIIDSAGPIPQTIRPLSGDPATAGKLYVVHVRWVCSPAKQSAAGNRAIIKSLAAANNTLWESTATDINYVEDSRVEQWWDIEGSQVTQLDAGFLEIYVK